MYILASQSPRRKWLMGRDISPDFKVVVSNADEHYPSDLVNPIDIVKYIAKEKGEIVHKDYPHDIVISADTIVVIDNKIIGKPKDEKDAFRMLRMLSGRTHVVYTGYAIFKEDKLVNKVVASEVTFNDLSDQFILDYIATGSPMDKAGAYGLQDTEKFNVAKEIKGSFENIVGFPTKEIKEDLSKI